MQLAEKHKTSIAAVTPQQHLIEKPQNKEKDAKKEQQKETKAQTQQPQILKQQPPSKQASVIKPFVKVQCRYWNGQCVDWKGALNHENLGDFDIYEEVERLDFCPMLLHVPYVATWDASSPINFDAQIKPFYTGYGNEEQDVESQKYFDHDYQNSLDVQFRPKPASQIVFCLESNPNPKSNDRNDATYLVGQHFKTLNSSACLRALFFTMRFLTPDVPLTRVVDHYNNYWGDLERVERELRLPLPELYVLIFSYLDPRGKMWDPADFWCFFASFYWNYAEWNPKDRPLSHDVDRQMHNVEYRWTLQEREFIHKHRFGWKKLQEKLENDPEHKHQDSILFDKMQQKLRYMNLLSFSEMIDFQQTLQLKAIALQRQKQQHLLSSLDLV